MEHRMIKLSELADTISGLVRSNPTAVVTDIGTTEKTVQGHEKPFILHIMNEDEITPREVYIPRYLNDSIQYISNMLNKHIRVNVETINKLNQSLHINGLLPCGISLYFNPILGCLYIVEDCYVYAESSDPAELKNRDLENPENIDNIYWTTTCLADLINDCSRATLDFNKLKDARMAVSCQESIPVSESAKYDPEETFF